MKNIIKPLHMYTGCLILSLILSASAIIGTTTYAATKQVSTGTETACAVTSGEIKCWGANESGQLGNRSMSDSSVPVSVYAVKNPAPVTPNPCGGWFQPSCTPVPQPSSPLGGKTVQKVSVGKTHACALADARVFCWGDNSQGQLGDRSNNDSSIPVAVDSQVDDITPAPVTPNPCGGWFQPSCIAITQKMKPKSSLGNKEVIDISAGDEFTCALSSDGAVSCWGNGANGRLGAGNTTSTNIPQAVYNEQGSALANKKGIRLAKASGSTMCVVVTSLKDSLVSSGSPVCWGYGIDDGTPLPANNVTTTACSSTSKSPPTTTTISPNNKTVRQSVQDTTSTTAPTNTTSTVIFSSTKPVVVPSVRLVTTLDGGDYVSALTSDGSTTYWGQYGYTKTVSYSNLTTCRYTCTGTKIGVTNTITLAKSKVTSKVINKGNNFAGTGSRGGFGKFGGGSFGPNMGAPQTAISGDGGGAKGGSTCPTITHYGYTASTVHAYTGKNAATVPPNWPLLQSDLKDMSGNAFNGLFCATSGSGGTVCDSHGTSSAEGQTGSAYTRSCTTSGGLFGLGGTTTCSPVPSGPQQVVTTTWPTTSSISSLNTGKSGYSCAIAADRTVGCWGVNTRGQLGVGDTNNRNVPVKVRL